MLTMTITNTSGEDIEAGDGTLPGLCSWASIADTDSQDFVIEMHDLERVENYHSGFMVTELLQKLVQAGKITVSFAAVADSNSVSTSAHDQLGPAAP